MVDGSVITFIHKLEYRNGPPREVPRKFEPLQYLDSDVRALTRLHPAVYAGISTSFCQRGSADTHTICSSHHSRQTDGLAMPYLGSQVRCSVTRLRTHCSRQHTATAARELQRRMKLPTCSRVTTRCLNGSPGRGRGAPAPLSESLRPAAVARPGAAPRDHAAMQSHFTTVRSHDGGEPHHRTVM